MGAVYRAFDRTITQGIVALKVLSGAGCDAAAKDRFLAEIRTVHRIKHPGVVRVFDGGVDETRGILYFWMELVEGRPLSQVLREADGQLSPAEAIRITTQLCDILTAVHENTIHLDLKPSNIMIAPNGTVRLLDFGISRRVSEPGDRTAVAGTPYREAPEQVEGGAIDARTDIFALGTILYEMLTGKAPHVGAKHPSECRSEVPPWLGDAAMRCLERSKQDRFENAEALRRALAPPTSTPNAPNRKLAVVAIAVLALAFLVQIGWFSSVRNVPGDLPVTEPVVPVAESTSPAAEPFATAPVLEAPANEPEPFSVEFDTSPAGTVAYRFGEPLRLRVTPSETCWGLLFCIDSKGETILLWPNAFQRDTRLPDGVTTVLPHADAIDPDTGAGDWRIAPPAGPVELHLYLLGERPNLLSLGLESTTRPYHTLSPDETIAEFLEQNELDPLERKTITFTAAP